MYIIRLILIIMVLLLGAPSLLAQKSRAIIDHIPKQQESSRLRQLALQITYDDHTAAAKSQAIFEWIATHIKYDTDLRYDRKLQHNFFRSEHRLIEKALERKKTVCAGYAYLFQALCNEIGVTAVVIDGFTKKVIPSQYIRKKVHHTWNAVKIEGKWQLLDITWATSYGNNRKPDYFWYRTSPSEFLLTHYPQDLQWTLVACPPSFEAFEGILSAP